MLLVLPFLTFVGLTLILKGSFRSGEDVTDLLPASFTAWSLLGAFLVIVTELLGLVQSLGKGGVLAVWAGLAILIIVALAKRGFKPPRLRFEITGWQDRTTAIILFAGLMLIVSVTLLIAAVSTPNNVDSLLYHLPRIEHWLQNQTLRHYPTAYDHQLFMPIFPEIAMLHLMSLSGAAAAANLVQWSSLLITLIGIVSIVQELGGDWRAQGIAALFAASIPMVILQATSTQTDLVTTAWLMITIFFIVRARNQQLTWLETVALGCAIGVGALSKHTYYPFAFPFLILFSWDGIHSQNKSRFFLQILLFLSLFLAINGGYFARNYLTFGNPFSPPAYVQTHSTFSLNPLLWIANTIDHLFLHFVSPVENLNSVVEAGLTAFRTLLGVEDGTYLRIWSWNHEDLAGSPIHLALVLAAMIIIAIRKKLRRDHHLRAYALTAIASFLIFGVVIDVFPYAARHHITFLATFAPIIGMISATLHKRVRLLPNTLLPLFLIVISLPWLFINRSRPLVGMKPRTMSDSILEEPAFVVLFANRTDLREPYRDAANVIIESSCREIGLEIDSHDYEFPLWWFLQQANVRAHIEAINATGPLEAYMDPGFEPCAIFSALPARAGRHPGYSLEAIFPPYSIYLAN